MSPVEKLLEKLPDAKPSGKGWSARCPAHEDRQPSLSISEGDDGRALVKCHAGCETEAICAALGLRLADLMPPTDRRGMNNVNVNGNRQKPKKQSKPLTDKAKGKLFASADDAVRALERSRGPRTAMWTYHNVTGDELAVVMRWDLPDGKKEFLPVTREADGWRIVGMPEPRPLYRLPDLSGASRVYVCEGEKAADAVRSLGLVATTSAHGCESPGKTDWSPLAGKEVIILPDNDKAGQDYAEAVAGLLSEFSPSPNIKLVELPELPEKGDAADFVAAQAGTDKAELRQALETLASDAEALMLEVSLSTEEDAWPEIESIEISEPPAFPTHVLPEDLRSWVEAESEATQTPPDLAALLALAVCSATIAKRVIVEPRPGWHEPVNLYTTVLLEPGNRKSAVFTDAIRPLIEVESELREAARPQIASTQSDRRQKEARLKNLEKFAAEKVGDSASEARHEALKLAEELSNEIEPVEPRLIVQDATEEKIGLMLEQQGGRIASMSPEGGVFDLMAGKYGKNNAPQFIIYLLGHSGDDHISDRVGRPSVRVRKPAITCAYAIQPEVIKSLANTSAFRGRGLLARFLYAAPQSRIGQRTIAPPPMPDFTRERYRQTVRKLSELDGETVLQLSVDAESKFRDWEHEIEAMLDDAGRMESIRDWGAKLAGETLRLAAVMHCVERGSTGQIEAATIESAIEIAHYLIPHADAVLNMMSAGNDATVTDARYVLRWIRRHERREFTKSEAQHHGKRRFPRADDIDPALAELERRGYLRKKPERENGPGRPASPAFEVNPSIFSIQKSGMRSRNSQNSQFQNEGRHSGNIGNELEQTQFAKRMRVKL
jgi:hypothetical protein